MGIKGLWSEVRPLCRQSHLSNFRGQRVAVDMYVWLHRGILGSIQLSGEEEAQAFMESAEASLGAGGAEGLVRLNAKFLQFVVNRVELLLRCGIHPVLVFDGAPIPMKSGTEEERQMTRAARLAAAVRVLKDGSAANPRIRQEAAQLLEKGVDITTELAHAVIQVLQERRLECIVAPYEADAQLAYMCKEGYVQAVISEDSDLIAYHCPCQIAKLDAHGNCEVFLAQDLKRCPSFSGLSYESFLVGCILSGCDYLPSLRHIGVKKAFRLVAQATSVPSLMHALEVKFGFSKEELREYESKLQQAFYCFAHHFVFDPVRKEVAHLTPLPAGIPLKANLLGKGLPRDIAEKVCGECLYDPVTLALYRGTYQYCVQEYWRVTKGGQTSLNAFGGFQDIQSPRVTLPLAARGENAIQRRASPRTTLFSSPLLKVREASGFCTNTLHTPAVVRSKYFTQSRWKVEDWESDGSENTPTAGTPGEPESTAPTTTTTTTASSSSSGATAAATSTVDATPPCAFPGIRFTMSESLASSALTTPSTANVKAADALDGAEMVEEMEGQSQKNKDTSGHRFSFEEAVLTSPSDTGMEVRGRRRGATAPDADSSECQGERSGRCPFGYAQCGRRHSIFEQCFQGKNWSRDASYCSKGESFDGNSSKDDVCLPPTPTEAGTKRHREALPPPLFRPTFKPPASTEGRPTDAPLCEGATSPTRKGAMKTSTAQALQLMNRLTGGRSGAAVAALQAGEGTGGTKAASELFEKLAFSR
ncbi:putative exonuclease [Trypanosoma grayi]|uniref:putative exonuclease n=1 Tax=Trypanosoma grayi TaxID=71804 RepID=UPI0004F445FE|nr:putative exonuclease [Trypanosoma grayi]KEG07731.1 putative exonuclease [Trypanosoma grayi]